MILPLGSMINRKVLVIYSNTNSKGLNDAKGAFIPEAKAFRDFHNVPDSLFVGMKFPGVPKAKRRERTLNLIHDAGASGYLDGLAFFGHGWPDGLQCGLNRKDIPTVAALLSRSCATDVKIVLYACLTAENDLRDTNHKAVGPGTDGGFADLLRDEIARWGLLFGHIDAHKPKGHTVFNPYLVRFLCDDVTDVKEGAEGGAWLVAPRSQHWRQWTKVLREEGNTLRYRFPFMSELDVKLELSTPAC